MKIIKGKGIFCMSFMVYVDYNMAANSTRLFCAPSQIIAWFAFSVKFFEI
jgi:hypothetical protein